MKSSLLYKCSRLVCVSDRGWKNDLLKTTNCFTFGVNSRLFSDDSRIVSVETAYEQIAIMALYVNKGKLPQLAAEFNPIIQQSIAKRVETTSHGTNQ